MKKDNNSVPIGGDPANLECSKCGSNNTVFEDYIKPNTGDETELGILCQDCNHREDPDELGYRFEPEYNPE
jgi:DNA-directed RNA polymerase subunit RPC12/RpoP